MKSLVLSSKSICLLLVLCCLNNGIQAQHRAKELPDVLSVRDQANTVFEMTRLRLEKLIPSMMEQTGIDMWIIACNEDNLDPVFFTMVPFKMWCPITQVLVFYQPGPGKEVERLNLSRTNLDGLFTSVWDYGAWDRGEGESQWDCLKRIVNERNPVKIGINTGDVQWAAGALPVPLKKKIDSALGKKYTARLVSAEPLVELWCMTMLEEEMDLMERAQAISHSLIAETYSSYVITPGVTTIDDLMFHYWQRVTDLGLNIGAHPRYRIRGRTQEAIEKYGADDKVIRAGDFIFCDVVLIYMRYYTDHAEWAYVLKPGEEDAPEEFKKLMAEGNRLQDIFCGEFREGLTGDELLKNILGRANAEKIPSPKIYSHSVGYFLHETGPLIGLPWEQVSNPGRGDVPLRTNSCYAMELSVSKTMESLGGTTFTLPLEQIVWFSDQGVVVLDGRQKSFHLVR